MKMISHRFLLKLILSAIRHLIYTQEKFSAQTLLKKYQRNSGTRKNLNDTNSINGSRIIMDMCRSAFQISQYGPCGIWIRMNRISIFILHANQKKSSGLTRFYLRLL
jgi:hypothetical protein